VAVKVIATRPRSDRLEWGRGPVCRWALTSGQMRGEWFTPLGETRWSDRPVRASEGWSYDPRLRSCLMGVSRKVARCIPCQLLQAPLLRHPPNAQEPMVNRCLPKAARDRPIPNDVVLFEDCRAVGLADRSE
jgi:hypothetical protein